MLLSRSNQGIPMEALFKRFVLIYLPAVSIFCAAMLLSIRFDDQMRLERIEGGETGRVEIARRLVAQDFSEAESDLRMIASLPMVRRFLDSGDAAQREEVADLLLVLARESRRYDQVRYLDAGGQEVIRINYNGGKPAIVPREELQNKSGRYFFLDTLKLNQGEMFVSPLDLNIEQGSLEIPYKPMIRFGMPVFDSAGRKQGMVMLNYLGSRLIQRFREAMQGGDSHNAMLLNRDGYWLSSSRPEDEWGFMLGKSERKFGQDFPEEWRAISSGERGALPAAQGLFVYTTVYPLGAGQHSSTGASLADAPSRHDLAASDYYWKIVSFIPHDVLYASAFYNQTYVRVLFAIACLVIALAAWIIAHVTLSRARAQSDLSSSNARYDELSRRIPVGIYLLRAPTGGPMRFEYVSQVFCRILGLDADDVLRDAGKAFAAAHPDDRDGLVNTTQEAISGMQPCRWEGRFVVNGETRWIRISSDPTPQADGSSLWSGVVSDITERKKLEHELKRQARIDVLTGLNNRRHFFEQAEQALAHARRRNEALSVLMLDVDHFKAVNDIHGHDSGDAVLKKLGEVCIKTLREIDIIGRLGGEEFAVLLPDTAGGHALEVAERLRKALAEADIPLELGGSIRFTVSIGVSSLAAAEATVEDMLRRADSAMYAAKNTGRNRVCGDGTA